MQELLEEPSAPEPTAPEPPAPEPPAPAPKRRGRPPKAQTQTQPVAKAKPAAKRAPRRPPPPSDSSSSDDSDESLNRDDMETMLLSYLVQRKNQQADKRRAMWSQLAGLS